MRLLRKLRLAAPRRERVCTVLRPRATLSAGRTTVVIATLAAISISEPAP
jgi:hypothetical protein